MKYNLICIDAWAESEDGWTWNNSWTVLEDIELSTKATNRQVFKCFRENGVPALGKYHCLEEYGEANIELQDKRTGEPLYALVAVK